MKYLILIATLLICHSVYSQVTPDTLKTIQDTTVKTTPPPPATTASSEKTRRDTRPFKERIEVGFGSSFWITPNTTYVEIAPVLAYRFPKVLITGIGYRDIYQHDRVRNNDLNSWGPNFFARASLTKRIYLWTEYEILQNKYFDNSYGSNEENRTTNSVDSWFGGIGYVRSLRKNGRGGVSVQVLYNFLYSHDESAHNLIFISTSMESVCTVKQGRC